MNNQSQIVTLEDCKVRQITSEAILIDFYGVEDWVPRSQCSCSERIEIDQQFDVDMPMWLAQSKGFI